MEFLCKVLFDGSLWFSNVHEFLNDNGFYGSFLAAVSFALVVFFIKEYLNPAKDINGNFFVYSKTISSSYGAYIDLVTERNIVIFSDGKSVRGTSEKTREKKIDVDIFEYKHHDRVRADVEGFIERRYLRSSKLHLHLIEDNKKSRVSTVYFQINLGWWFRGNGKKKGNFYATAADSKGEVLLCRRRCALGSI
ncbi:hypothetical protein KAH39_08415 [Alcaligenes faecalis]|uniref:hypothetical protein n=1 Tax=Alcaligenes faecalis TaxID=511 RepID=UPI000F674291|nr:hypothetical protein [Alcaligenes faecalis]MBQ0217323.1 hypothetical protein [Alcaligenes faecalis]